MLRRSASLSVFLALVATVTTALAAESSENPPEKLLAEESVAYVRFDGMEAHKEAYEQTILAQLVNHEFGPLIEDVTKRILDALGPQVVSERLLGGGVKPDQLIEIQNANKKIPQILDCLRRHGVAVGVEVMSPLEPRFQITVVFPEGGRQENRSAITSGIRLVGLLTKTDVQEMKVGEREVLALQTPEPIKVAFWQEAEHMVLTVGTEEVGYTLELLEGKRDNLTRNPIFKQIAAFDHYESVERGFIDFDRATALAESSFPPAGVIIDRLGLNGLKRFTFQIGFHDKHIRSTLVLDMPDEREGVLRLFSPEGEVQCDQLPAFPPDATVASVSRFDIGRTYETILDAVEAVISVASPGDLTEFKQGLDSLKQAIGIDLADDLFSTLGPTLMFYTAPSEGPFNVGAAVVVNVKAEDKLLNSLETMIKSLAATTRSDIQIRKREAGGAVLNVVDVDVPGFPFAPTYTVHDGWLVASFYPQTVQGFVFRSSGKHEVWEQPAFAKQAIADATRGRAGNRVTTVSISDPRPAVAQILSLAPFTTKLATSISGTGSDFDISLIPHAQAVTEKLTHNVSVVVHDGKSVRFEGYASLPIPAQLTGLEIYTLSFALIGVQF